MPPVSWFFQEEFWRSITIGVVSGTVIVVGGLLAAAGLGFIGSDNVTGTIQDITVTAAFLILPFGVLVFTFAVFESSLRWWERAVAVVLALFCGGFGLAIIFNGDTAPMVRVAGFLFDDALDFLGAVLVAFK